MSLKDLATAKLAEIRTLLGIKLAEEPAAADQAPADTLKEYQTANGATVKIDKLEMGGKVVDVDGTTPLAGDITLSDGTMITAGPDGVITAVTVPPLPTDQGTPAATPAAPAPLSMEEATAILTKFATGTPEERVANVEIICRALMQNTLGWKIDEASRKANEDAAIAVYRSMQPAAMAEAVNPIKTEFAALKKQNGEFKEALIEMLALVQQFAAAPSGNPAQAPSGSGASQDADPMERAARMVEMLEKARQLKS